MNLSPLMQSDWIIILHTIAAILAVLLGGLQFLQEKGTVSHRVLGRVWVSLMLLVALSSFLIHEIRMFGPFSVIHLLSLIVFYSLWEGIKRVRKGDISGHRKTMIQLYVFALILTGAFTLAPGRILYRVVFGA